MKTTSKIPMMKKVVINTKFGGFGLSLFAAEQMKLEIYKIPYAHYPPNQQKKVITYTQLPNDINVSREDPKLIELIEKYGSEKISGSCARLKIVEIPGDVEYVIEEYDGKEHIAEKHRTWS